MQKNCKNCKAQFEVTDADMKFYEKVSPEFNGKKYLIPPPKLCPECRQQRRLTWCNERTLYQRECNISKKKIISMFHADISFPVYYVPEWWSDKWNPMDYGEDLDFTKTFYEQFNILSNKVPRPSLNVVFSKNENCEYVNYAGNVKNCYLIFESDYSQDCYYGYTINDCKNTLDSLKTSKSQLCYECIDCHNCYNLKYAINCRNCSDSFFLKNCVNCKNCFGSSNLKNKEYYFLNKKLSAEEYNKRLNNLELQKSSNVAKNAKTIKKHHLEFPNKYMRGFKCENCTGDSIFNAKNTLESFDCLNTQDCKHCYSISFNSKDCYDLYQFGENTELCYESVVVGYNSNITNFCLHCYTSNSALFYCQFCHSCQDCFACIGLRHKQYCILNKQYTKEKYEELVPKIIEHMKSHGEWGEFFPVDLSPFAYNETMAQEYFPLKKEDVLKKGWDWKDEEDNYAYQGPKVEVPDSISEVSDEICDQILTCEQCSKHYKIIKQELKFYRKLEIPVPRNCPNCRHANRMALRNPRKLWDRKCDKCGKDIQTSYAPDRPETVYCEECYLKEVY